jgi:hypothetical protein
MFKILSIPGILKILLSNSLKKKHCDSVESTKMLKLFREVINIYSVDHTKTINNLRGKTKFLKLTAGGTYHQWAIEY